DALCDGAVRAGTGVAEQFDADGRLAARGAVDQQLLQLLLEEEYYRRPAPKSTGKELFHPGYLDRFLAGRSPSLEDLVATLTALTARTVAAPAAAPATRPWSPRCAASCPGRRCAPAMSWACRRPPRRRSPSRCSDS